VWWRKFIQVSCFRADKRRPDTCCIFRRESAVGRVHSSGSAARALTNTSSISTTTGSAITPAGSATTPASAGTTGSGGRDDQQHRADVRMGFLRHLQRWRTDLVLDDPVDRLSATGDHAIFGRTGNSMGARPVVEAAWQ
jgi:hypothetical protein